MSGRSHLPVRDRLAAGPKAGLGAANAIAAQALGSAAVLGELVAALEDERAVVVARAANALKKVQVQQPELLAPYAKKLLRAGMECEELEARWNLTLVVGKLHLRGRDKALAVEMMFEALRSASSLMRTFALQGLVDLAAEDATLRARVRPIVEEVAQRGSSASAAMRARARKLLAQVG